MFTFCDAAFLTCMIRQFKPKRVVEVGSGTSTKVARDALKTNLAEGHPATLTAIDPKPRVNIEGVNGWVKMIVQEAPLEHFLALRRDDILIIDSSHMMNGEPEWYGGGKVMQGDVQVMWEQVLPRLAPGVLVHVHDVYLPGECAHGVVGEDGSFRAESTLTSYDQRAWDESPLLQIWMQHNPMYEVVTSSNFWDCQRGANQRLFQESMGQRCNTAGANIWLRRTSFVPGQDAGTGPAAAEGAPAAAASVAAPAEQDGVPPAPAPMAAIAPVAAAPQWSPPAPVPSVPAAADQEPAPPAPAPIAPVATAQQWAPPPPAPSASLAMEPTWPAPTPAPAVPVALPGQSGGASSVLEKSIGLQHIDAALPADSVPLGIDLSAQAAQLGACAGLRAEYEALSAVEGGAAAGGGPFAWCDVAMLWCEVRTHRPARVLQIGGSAGVTDVLRRALGANGAGARIRVSTPWSAKGGLRDVAAAAEGSGVSIEAVDHVSGTSGTCHTMRMQHGVTPVSAAARVSASEGWDWDWGEKHGLELAEKAWVARSGWANRMGGGGSKDKRGRGECTRRAAREPVRGLAPRAVPW